MRNIFILLTIIITLSSCLSKTKKPAEDIKNRTWEGQIYRHDDDKLLSDVRLKFSSDSLYIYSNAIFGAENDTLILVKHEEKDTTYVFKNPEGQTFKFIYQYEKDEQSEYLYLFGTDYYVVLGLSEFDISEPASLDFYQNIAVPGNAYMYLDGAYEGIVEFENQMLDLFSLFSMGPVKIKFVFLDGFRVKTFGGSFWGSGSEIKSYTVSGDRIFIQSNGKKGTGGKFETEGLQVVDNGYKLVSQTDDANLVLIKSY